MYVQVLVSHDAAVRSGAPVPDDLARKMDGALLAVGTLNDVLKAKVSWEVGRLVMWVPKQRRGWAKLITLWLSNLQGNEAWSALAWRGGGVTKMGKGTEQGKVNAKTRRGVGNGRTMAGK